MARGQSSQGQGCTECLGLSWPDTTPQSQATSGGALPSSEPPGGQTLGRSHTLRGALYLQPPPRPPGVTAARICLMVPAGLRRNAD